MIPFLKQVADHYYKTSGVEGRCFIFPNRRSMVFFKKYLTEAVASASDRPVIMPEMLTVSEFFGKVSPVSVADRHKPVERSNSCFITPFSGLSNPNSINFAVCSFVV